MESRYWKEMLAETARELAYRKKPKRLTERRCEIIERNVILCFFIIRRLVELDRVTTLTSKFKFDVFTSSYNGKTLPFIEINGVLKPLVDRVGVDKLYHFDSEERISETMWNISNQFIHSSLFVIARDITRNWHSFYVVSDYAREKHVLRIPVEQVAELFNTASKDYPGYV